ncbi:MAG TPA: ABC transporter permease [Blastocatellia bacterium]|nr:ABC transporter permease [Blastocatellia bacterium]
MALATINERRVRSALTLLGIAVGTTTVIVIGSVLTGMGQRVTDIANNFGPNVLLVSKYDSIGPRFQARSVSERTRKNLTVSDVEAINALPSVDGASPQVQLGNFDPSKSGVSVKYEGTEYSRPLVSGVDANFADVRSLKIEEGRFFAAAEERRRARLVVIPSAAVQHLFGGLNPIDKEIQLDGLAFRVVGVRERSVGGLFGGESMDDRIFYVPYRTLETLHPELDDISISVKARDGQLDVATSEITEVLRLSRGRRVADDNDFSISKPEAIFESFREIQAILALVVVPISGAGLLVGGVGVMNILLVSVTERTREIGVRRAVGARRSDIVLQFLLEAATLTSLGGAAGVVLGWTLSELANVVLPSIPSVVPMWAVATGLGVSVATGLVFGVWPAIKAARLDPIRALHYE